MEEKNKKRIIALLLLVSCLTSAILLVFTTASTTYSLKSFAQADSLLMRDFDTFGISDDQLQVQTINVDSAFARKNYRVALPPGFSKTQLHTEVHKTFGPYGIEAPARVLFPGREVDIQLLYKNTVIRSILLYTDPELQMKRSYGSILVVLESMPSEEMLQTIIGFGEPLAIVLKTEDPARAGELKSEVEQHYPHLLFWLEDEEGENIFKTGSASDLPRLQQLQEVAPDAGILGFTKSADGRQENVRKLLSETSLRYVDVSEAVLLDPVVGEAAFKQELNKFHRQAQRNLNPIAIVEGSARSLQWLQEELAEYKKAGLRIVLPDAKRF